MRKPHTLRIAFVAIISAVTLFVAGFKLAKTGIYFAPDTHHCVEDCI